MRKPNKPDAVNPAMALWLTIEDQWRRVTDLERSATLRTMETPRIKRPPPRWKRWKGLDGNDDDGVELVGDWSERMEPPSFAREDAYNVRIGGEFFGEDLACLRLLPKIRKLSIFNYRIRDFSGIHALPKLEVLSFIQRHHRSRLNLDFSKLPNLRKLRVEWDGFVTNQGDLKRLTHLRIAGCSGVKHLDLTGLRSLVALDIGPAKGVEKVSLHGIPRLRRLTLALMTNLRHVEGDRFHETVTHLSIPGTKKLSRSLLASFRKLKSVDVGTRGTFTTADFPNSRPAVWGLPV